MMEDIISVDSSTSDSASDGASACTDTNSSACTDTNSSACTDTSTSSQDLELGLIRCFVCFERKPPFVVPCGHNFCKQCVLRNKEVYNKCPMCRDSWVNFDPVGSLPRRQRVVHRARVHQNEFSQICSRVLCLGGFTLVPFWINILDRSINNGGFDKAIDVCFDDFGDMLACWSMGLIYFSIGVCILYVVWIIIKGLCLSR